MLIAVTDHAAERYRQRVRGTLDEKNEIRAAVARAFDAQQVEDVSDSEVRVRDPRRPSLVYLCRRQPDELVVVTLWEEGEDAAVPRRFTDALRREDRP